MIKAKVLQSSFARRVSTLLSGTAIAQLIAILSLPVLTRLYTAEDFSVLAVYSSVLTLLAVVSCLRFEIAIPLPKSDRTAAALCILAVVSVLLMSTIAGLLVFFFPMVFNGLTDNKIDQYLWFVPAGVFAVGLYNAMQYWAVRKKKFFLISKTRIAQSATGASVKLGAGYFFNGWTAGLVAGQLIAMGAGFISLGLALLKNDWNKFKVVRPIHLRAAFKRYDKFPKYSTWEALANAGSIQIPIILIAYYSADAEVGYLMIAMQLLSAPMGFIGAAVAQVYLTEGAERFHNGGFQEFTRNTVFNLAKFSCVPLLIVAICSPVLVPYVLGAEWERTGSLIVWMVPWFFMQLITSPVSMSLHITGSQRIAFILQMTGLFLRVGGVLVGAMFSVKYISEFYALSGLVFYVIYMIVVFKVVSKDSRANI
tara:strand:- start:4558 stop:5829 length:1272 start_codon:yes stop_codon:yes gene_type:complete